MLQSRDFWQRIASAPHIAAQRAAAQRTAARTSAPQCAAAQPAAAHRVHARVRTQPNIGHDHAKF
jgi:hypothetical protein